MSRSVHNLKKIFGYERFGNSVRHNQDRKEHLTCLNLRFIDTYNTRRHVFSIVFLSVFLIFFFFGPHSFLTSVHRPPCECRCSFVRFHTWVSEGGRPARMRAGEGRGCVMSGGHAGHKPGDEHFLPSPSRFFSPSAPPFRFLLPAFISSPSFLLPASQGSFKKCSPARESAIVSSVSDLPGGGGRPNSCQQEILPESPMRFNLSGSDVECARCRDSVCWRVRRMSGKIGRCAGSESQHSPIRVCGREGL